MSYIPVSNGWLRSGGVALALALFACSGGSKPSGSSGSDAPSGGAQNGSGKSGENASGRGQGAAGKANPSAGATSAAGKAASAGKGSTSAGAAASGGRTAGSGSTSPVTSASVLERNNHPSRDGHFMQPMLTKAAAAKLAKDANFKATFTGNMWASPLYVENGPGDKGVFFAVTTGNDVFALDETSGAVTWMKHLGDSPMESGAGCGSIHPIGILSTPVIEAGSRTLFVAAAVGTNSIARHELHALSIDDGNPRAGWPLDISKLSAGSLKFNPAPHNQRSALSLVNGTVYVAYGGHVGDCGDYHGWVVGVDSKDPSKNGAWASLGRGEGIWAAGGMASDGTSVFAVTGNSTIGASDRAKTDSEAVVRITGLGSFTRDAKNHYFPTSWKTMDGQDADFGASNPVFIEVPGATPARYVLAIAKDGHLYMLDSENLGGMAGHKVDFSVSTGPMTVRTVPTVYTTASGVHVAFVVEGSAKCPAGSPTGKVVMSVSIPAGSPPAPKVAWCTALSGSAAPITTTTDGTSDPIVWFISGGKLVGVDGETGAAVYTSSDTCSGVQKWTSPIAVKGRIVVGGDGHLCSWSPQ